MFSCEFCDKKQKWIAENFPDLEFLFKDIKTLKDTEQASLLDDRLEEGPLYPRGCGPVFEMIEEMKIPKWSLSKYFKQFKVGKLGMPTTRVPNKREERVIEAGKLKIKGRKAARDNVLVDLAKSETRAPVNLDATPCLVANNRMWWDNARRFLSAEEGMALQLQGFFATASDFPQLKSFLRTQSALCRDMTGNAFSMSVCTAVLNAVLLKVADHS